jgi:putative hemolysin
MRFHPSFFTVVLIALLLVACVQPAAPVPATAPAPAPATATAAQPATQAPVTSAPTSQAPATSAPAAQPTKAATTTVTVSSAILPVGWQVYANPAGFAIGYPPSWTIQAQPDTNDGHIHTQALKGAEGEVDLSWGVGFGGACPPGYIMVKVAQGYIQACYQKNVDGSESWTQMSYMLPNDGFSGQAKTGNAAPASHDLVLQILSTLTFAQVQTAGTTATPPVTAYADPFAYCSAIGTIDSPDARYTGPITPTVVIDGLAAAAQPQPKNPQTPAPPTPAPGSVTYPPGSVYWRCMDGNVYACWVGANIPCWAKADTTTTPSTGMVNYCKDQPDVDSIPAFATGHSTIYAWSCKNGVPVQGNQILQVDAQGYPTEFWYQIPPPASPAATSPAKSTAAPQATATAAATLQPLSPADCTAMADGMAKTLGVKVTTDQAPIADFTTQAGGTGCQATATGTGEQFKSPDAVVKSLDAMLTGMGWTQDMMLASGGPTGMGQGYRKGSEICLASAIWQPSAAANCPKDQPISACNVSPAQQEYTVTLNCAQSAAAPAAAVTPTAAAPQAGMANPASVNCTKQGGTLSIQKNGTGGEYGVCMFEDNRQCEEWALLRDECPVGGLKVTGYVTPAAQYCAITGGTYTVTGNSNTPNETGTCTKAGKTCDATAYWNGGC